MTPTDHKRKLRPRKAKKPVSKGDSAQLCAWLLVWGVAPALVPPRVIEEIGAISSQEPPPAGSFSGAVRTIVIQSYLWKHQCTACPDASRALTSPLHTPPGMLLRLATRSQLQVHGPFPHSPEPPQPPLPGPCGAICRMEASSPREGPPGCVGHGGQKQGEPWWPSVLREDQPKGSWGRGSVSRIT